MDLYYSPFACSLAAHIVTREVGINVKMRRTDLITKRIDGGGVLTDINPMGLVPTLVLDDGRVVTENAAVLWYLAESGPEKRMLPDQKGFAHVESMSWMSFVASEVHKKINFAIFSPETPTAVKDFARSAASQPLSVIDRHLAQRDVLVGDSFGIADAYLFWALTIMPTGGVSLDAHPNVLAYHARHLSRPAVKEALRFERHLFGKPIES